MAAESVVDEAGIVEQEEVVPSDDEEIVAELNPLLTQIDQYELKIANALWVAKNFPFREEFLKNIADSYGTGAAMPADFPGNAETERERINQWIVEKTGGHIKDALPPDSIEPLTGLIITNAIYYNGQWAEPFPKRLTEKRDFFTAPEISSKVDIMRTVTKIGRYGSFEADGSLFNSPLKYDANNPPALYSGENGFAVYEMPYKGDEISMVIIAPNKINGLTDIEKSITADNLSTWISKLSQRETDVLLPKFEVNTGYSLNKTLIAMGMSSAFGADADFSGMTNTPTDIYISEVIHKAFIKDNEERTEAAAVTAFLAVGRALPKLIDFTPEFRADRPSLYLIRDKRSGSILFMGRITQPEA